MYSSVYMYDCYYIKREYYIYASFFFFTGIVLSWTMGKTEDHETIASYQLYAYQEGTAAPSALLWKKVGSVKALELPMACTLTQVRQEIFNPFKHVAC